jgi:ubiquinone/menaquinone biosynthesis C-methylase UbiE
MNEHPAVDRAIETMPRGGPDASWLDRLLQTDELEYTDRYDIPDEIKQSVVSTLDRMGARLGVHERCARIALEVVSDTPAPRILELGAGHGRLSAEILELHPAATVTVSDLDPTSVGNIARELGEQPRAQTRVIDATAIDAADDSYDLVIFAQSFHHLPPPAAAHAIAEGTRVGRRFLVIDLERQTAPWLLPAKLFMAPAAAAIGIVWPSARVLMHDGFISGLRAYSRSAFAALAAAAGPGIHIEFLTPILRLLPVRSHVIVFSRPGATRESPDRARPPR